MARQKKEKKRVFFRKNIIGELLTQTETIEQLINAFYIRHPNHEYTDDDKLEIEQLLQIRKAVVIRIGKLLNK